MLRLDRAIVLQIHKLYLHQSTLINDVITFYQSSCSPPSTTEKLLSLLPEYVVPYMIHLLAHDPDFTKPQDFEQLRDIKE